MICPNQHCSICGRGAMFEVLRAKKWEALCEDHLLWLMENARKMPETRRRLPKRCLCGVREGHRVYAPRDRSAYSRQWYSRNRERVLALAKQRRELVYAQIVSETVSTVIN